MKTISIKQLWIYILIFFILFSVASVFYASKLQEEKITTNLQESINIDIQRLSYTLFNLIDGNRELKINALLDEEVALNPLFESLSIGVTQEHYIGYSSNRKYISLVNKNLNYIEYRENYSKDIFVENHLIHINLDEENYYSLFIDLDRRYINYIYESSLELYLRILFFLGILFFSSLLYMLYCLIVKPVVKLDTKLSNANYKHDSDIVINELRNLDKSLMNNSKMIDSLINTTKDLIFFKDSKFRYLGCNDAFLSFINKTKEEMIGHTDFEIFDTEMAISFRQMDKLMLDSNEAKVNYEWVIYPDGQSVYLQTQKMPFFYIDNGTMGVLGISRDLTELHLANKKIKEQSYIDELTKINNRKSYNKKLHEHLSIFNRYGDTFSILMYDIDNFKMINDTYGHSAGDKVLVEMSALIQGELRESDYLFRIGGEEFIIIFSKTILDDALDVAEKIRKSVENKLISILEQKITISIGVTEIKQSDTEDSIFKRVDDLLYLSKNNGKNKVVSSK